MSQDGQGDFISSERDGGVDAGLVGRRRVLAGLGSLGAGLGAVAVLGTQPADATGTTYPLNGGSAGIPPWSANATYAVNQLVTAAGGTYACAVAHTAGSSFPGQSTQLWQVVGAIPVGVYVDSCGADATGGSYSDAAITAAMSLLGSKPGCLVFGPGTYKFAYPIPTLGVGQGVVGQGKAATSLVFHGSGSFLSARDSRAYDSSHQWDASGAPGVGGVFRGFTLDGTNAATSSPGFQYGDLLGGRIENIRIQNFSSSGSAGLYLRNQNTWAERTFVEVELINNQTALLFDGNGSALSSFDYSSYDVSVTCLQNQTGLMVQNGAQLQGVRLSVRGNFISATQNTGTAFVIGTSPTDSAAIVRSTLEWQVETDQGVSGGGHGSILMGGSQNAISSCMGVIDLLAVDSVAFQNAALNGGTFAFGGILRVPGLGSMSFNQAARVYGAIGGARGYVSPSGVLYLGGGNVFQLQLSAGNTSFSVAASDVTSMAGQAGAWDIILQQPASGGATATWPSNWVWAEGHAPTLKTAGNALDWIRVITADFASFWAEHLGAAPVRTGTVALTSGSSGLVANPLVTASSVIRAFNVSASGTVGALSITLSSGQGFTIKSTSSADVSRVFYEVLSY